MHACNFMTYSTSVTILWNNKVYLNLNLRETCKTTLPREFLYDSYRLNAWSSMLHNDMSNFQFHNRIYVSGIQPVSYPLEFSCLLTLKFVTISCLGLKTLRLLNADIFTEFQHISRLVISFAKPRIVIPAIALVEITDIEIRQVLHGTHWSHNG